MQARRVALAHLLRERQSGADCDYLAHSGRIEVERRKNLAERFERRGIESRAVMNIEGRRAGRRQATLDQGIELARQKMKGHIAAAIGIDKNEIVSFAIAVEKDTAIARLKAHALALAQPEISLGRGDHAGIDFDRGDERFRKETGEVGRNRSAAQSEHQ